jgi:RNA polymerase sigma-32 factor
MRFEPPRTMKRTDETIETSPATHKLFPLEHCRLLTREEEESLARQYRETHDPGVARKLVESHLRLVAKIARECCSRRELLPDLIQEGSLGLMRAVEKFDPERGIRLSSYAAWWIRAYIYQYILANSRMMRLATTFTQRKLFFNLNRECQRLERAGQPATSKDIAENLGVPEKAVVEMRARLGGRDVSFETTVAVDPVAANQRLDGASAPERPDDVVEDRNLREAVARRRSEIEGTLDERERVILDERLIAENPITLRQLGARFGISRERARQLENRLKLRLKPLFQEFVGPTRALTEDDEELAA